MKSDGDDAQISCASEAQQWVKRAFGENAI